MRCVKTCYKDEETANQVNRRAEISQAKLAKNQDLIRTSYYCETCGMWHVKKCFPTKNNFIAETGRFT